jgi:glycosyltransferase involved in cell wall biosynthesis
MRVGVNAFHLGPAIGGLRQYFESLLPALREADPETLWLLFHSAANAAAVEPLAAIPGVHPVRLGRPREARGYLDRLDLYFCPFGILDPRPVPLPAVVTLVDVQERHFPDFFAPADHWNRGLHFEGSTRRADAVVTISEFSRASIARHHGIDPDRIHVAHLCPDPRLLSAPDPDPAFVRSLPEGFVLYPANAWRHKNHELLLRAACRLRDEGLVVPLVFTGHDQPGGYPLAQRLRELGLQDQARVLGFVGVPELAHLYRSARLLAFPSLFEGFGLPLVEAMALGCPVVAADTSSIPEVVGDAALLFDPHDAASCAATLRRGLQDLALREGLKAAGRERARLFTPAGMAAAHREAFEAARAGFSFARYLRRTAEERWHRLRHYVRHGVGPPSPHMRAGSS